MKDNPKRVALGGKWYFYYAASLAQALDAVRIKEVPGPVQWGEALTDVLLKRQRRDGSWKNASPDDNPDREDDPVVATALAMIALTACRRQVAGE
jgi:hypothetical protein